MEGAKVCGAARSLPILHFFPVTLVTELALLTTIATRLQRVLAAGIVGIVRTRTGHIASGATSTVLDSPLPIREVFLHCSEFCDKVIPVKDFHAHSILVKLTLDLSNNLMIKVCFTLQRGIGFTQAVHNGLQL